MKLTEQETASLERGWKQHFEAYARAELATASLVTTEDGEILIKVNPFAENFREDADRFQRTLEELFGERMGTFVADRFGRALLSNGEHSLIVTFLKRENSDYFDLIYERLDGEEPVPSTDYYGDVSTPDLTHYERFRHLAGVFGESP
jgi:hypothetical protein